MILHSFIHHGELNEEINLHRLMTQEAFNDSTKHRHHLKGLIKIEAQVEVSITQKLFLK